MYSAAGDIVIVLDADTQPFQRSMGNATNDLKRSASDWNSVMQSMSGPGFARGLGQAGFALQDFTSVLSMGGKNALSRALMSTMNNVQMLGMAFGPMGAAATSVGGALASMLIPKLLESTEKTAELSEAFKEASKSAQEAGKLFADAVKFEANISDLSSPEAGQKMIKDLQTEEKILQRQRRDTVKLRDEARREGAAKPELSDERKVYVEEEEKLRKELQDIDKKISDNRGKQFDLRNKIGEAEAAKFAEDSMKKALEKDKEKAKAEVAQAKERDDAIEAAQKANERRDEQRRNTARQITEQYASPFEAAQYKIDELKQNLADGTIGQDLYDKATGKIIDQFGKQNVQQDQKLGGAQAGSASAFEQIRESIRDANRTADGEQIKLLKRQADNSDSMKTSLDKLTDAPVLRVEGIA